jgi:hypothetical protein
MKRLRDYFERIAFAGLKPGEQRAQQRQLKWLGPLSGPIERYLSGGAQSDPLYLTNRSTNQKIRSWLLIGIPSLLLVVAIGIATSNIIDPPEAKPQKELTAKEIASKLLPGMDKEIKLTTNPDVQVVEIAVQHHGGTRLVGVVHNNTSHEIGTVELVIDVTDTTGSQVGGVSGTVLKVPAQSNKEFQFSIKQKDAAFALIREIISR